MAIAHIVTTQDEYNEHLDREREGFYEVEQLQVQYIILCIIYFLYCILYNEVENLQVEYIAI